MTGRTPLYEKHRQLKARIISFGGFEMPVYYAGIRQEHQAVREKAGLFDVSHMGEFIISGPGALGLMQKLTVNDVTLLETGRAQYSAMCYEDGGIVDDLLVYMLGPDRYMMVVNAANIKKDREWILSHATSGAECTDRSDRTALVALQGPEAASLLQPLTDLNLRDVSSFSFATGTVAGQREVMVSATGYTGEKGFELFIDTEKADAAVLWDSLLEEGAGRGLEPAGLGARDTLRLEMGFPLYGNDITGETTPLEGRLDWITRFEKGEFIGHEALRKQKREGLKRQLSGFVVEGSRQIPRSGYEILNGQGEKTGVVTSGTQSVTLGIGIGMGYLKAGDATAGSRILISIRNRRVPAIVTRPPFIRK